MLVDTHAHLNFKDFKKDLDQVIKRSVENGVAKIICVGNSLADSKKAIEIAKKYPKKVFAAIGIHPQDTAPDNLESDTLEYRKELEKQIKQLGKLAQEKEVIAIGECGLDYSPAPPGEKDRTKKDQAFLFKRQLEIALKFKLPVIIHTRKAFHETTNILEQYAIPKLEGVFHCYSAGKKGIKKVNQLGFFYGVDGNLTYEEGLQIVFQQIPLEKILLETDCPFLAPEPFHGQRSEPAYIKIIAEFLAKLKKIQPDKIAQATTQNAEKLFQI